MFKYFHWERRQILIMEIIFCEQNKGFENPLLILYNTSCFLFDASNVSPFFQIPLLHNSEEKCDILALVGQTETESRGNEAWQADSNSRSVCRHLPDTNRPRFRGKKQLRN